MTKQAQRYLAFLNGMGVSVNLDRVRVSLGDGKALEEWLRQAATYEYAAAGQRKRREEK